MVNNKGYLVKGSVTGSNAAHASTAQSYTVSPDALAKVDITEINSNFAAYSELGGMMTITGKVELSGLFKRGMNASAVSSFKVLIGENSYTASLDYKTQTFELKIPVAEVAAMDGSAISFDFGTTSNVFTPASDDRGYWFRRHNNTEVTYDSLTLTGDYVVDNGNGSYSIKVPNEQMATISGKVSGLVPKAGDIVEIELGGKLYQAEVQANNTFNVNVPAALLAENNEKAVTATLITTDLANNTIQVSDIEAYLTPENVSSDYVQPLHADIPTDKRKYNHLEQENPEEFNYPYFMDMFRGASYGYNHYSKVPFGGGENAVIKYHFVSADEGNGQYASKMRDGAIAGTYLDLDDEHKELLHQIFAKFDEYVNVKFEYSNDFILDSTGINISKGKHPNTAASAFATQGVDLIFNAHGGGGVYWGNTGWSAYISIHELTHNFGYNHTSLYFTDEKRDTTFGGMGAGSIEDTTLLSYMSYNYGDKTAFAVTGYDLAAMHYRYGVNPNTRAGDDVYSFQRFADAEDFGGIYIWDGNGVDTFDASMENDKVYINLKPGSWIYRGTQEKMLTIKSATKYNAVEWFADELDPNAKVLESDTRTVKEFVEGQAFIGYGTQIENAIGSDYDDILIGNEADNNLLGGKGNDVLKGGKGNDYLDGGAGNDEMHGGEGNDIYVVDSAGDKVIELVNEGTDTVISFIDYTLGDHVENLTLMGTTATIATGNELDNTLVANNIGNNLNGGAGNDRLIGGLGADTLTGGDGNDTFVFNTALNGNVDTIVDFSEGDKIELSKAVFSAIDSVENVMNYIKYDKSNGELSYQESSNVDAVHFATVQSLYALEQNHFTLV